MTKPLVVLNIVGLTHEMLGPNTPHLMTLARDGFARPMGTVLPAVTCTAQATLLTGAPPREHGIVANGWYFRETAEIRFWLQSHHLVGGTTLQAEARRRDPQFTTAKMFWWFNMYDPDADLSVTPRPSYPADGRKVFDSYSRPTSLKDELQQQLGVFPLFRFWGPTADIRSSRWIADASVSVFTKYRPSLTLVYLPHLDYNLQRWGPHDPRIAEDIRAVDAEAGKLIEAARAQGATVVVVSEYAITEVSQPVHLNRVLREAGLLTVRREPLGWETLDAGASVAFAVADHQVAHVYVNDPARYEEVRRVLKATRGVDAVLDRQQQASLGIDHARSGEFVVVAQPGAWFTYYFWLDDRLAPDYARTVDIHRKPGYDPAELFVNPTLRVPQARVAWRLAQKMLGFRYYMDVIGLDASIVRGSHGRLPTPGHEVAEAPVFLCSDKRIERDEIPMTSVKGLLLDLLELPSSP